ncbi:MAG: PDDEXK nuclease domain-containing protein [Candidatus Binatia bacterium]
MSKGSDKTASNLAPASYDSLIGAIRSLVETARHSAARSVNALMTATYWEIGRRIVEFEQRGKKRAGYGQELLKRLSSDLCARFGRGFGVDNLQRMRGFYLAWGREQIYATVSRKSTSTGIGLTTSQKSQKLSAELGIGKSATMSRIFDLSDLAQAFPLPWSHYVHLLTVKNRDARDFYEIEALHNGWSARQLDRQISSLFYERTALSRNKATMLAKAATAKPEDLVTPEEEIKDPFVLEFLDLKDEYSESDLEEGLIRHLEHFLLELGGDFAFIGRQKRLRVGGEWYRVDLIFFPRRLRCLVIVDLKIGKFSHADAGQMHLYLNYAREHWSRPEENPPVGLILCAQKDDALARYALEGLPNKVLAREDKLALPNEKLLAREIERTRKVLEARRHVV